MSDNHADEYTDVPPHNLPAGYLENATEEDPPPTHTEASTSTASSSTRGAKRRLPMEPSSANVGKWHKQK